MAALAGLHPDLQITLTDTPTVSRARSFAVSGVAGFVATTAFAAIARAADVPFENDGRGSREH